MDGQLARGEGGEEGSSEGWMVEGGDQIVPDDSGLSVISEEAASIFSHLTSNRLQPDRYLGKNVWSHLYQVTFEFRTPP